MKKIITSMCVIAVVGFFVCSIASADEIICGTAQNIKIISNVPGQPFAASMDFTITTPITETFYIEATAKSTDLNPDLINASNCPEAVDMCLLLRFVGGSGGGGGGGSQVEYNIVSITLPDACDNQPPECSKAYADPDCVWPPNNKMVPVNIMGVTDPDGDPVTITITSVTSDEATATAKGAAGLKHAPDASGVGTSQAMIRAERSGLNDGRIYVINFMAEDGKGDMCNGSVVVHVPHDQSDKSCPAVDSGQKYDATKIN